MRLKCLIINFLLAIKKGCNFFILEKEKLAFNDKYQKMQATTETSFQATAPPQRSTFKHDPLNFALVFVNLFTYALDLFLSFASSAAPQLDIFPRTIANISREFDTEYTPAGWTFSTWVSN